MFRTVPLSIIRSFSIYTLQWYMSYRFADSLQSTWNMCALYGLHLTNRLVTLFLFSSSLSKTNMPLQEGRVGQM